MLLVPSLIGVFFSALLLCGTLLGPGLPLVFDRGFAAALGLFSIATGLLGHTLTVKKQVLECTRCQVVIEAS
jgi:hypothetical protein